MGKLLQRHGDGVHSSLCTMLALPAPGVDISGTAWPDISAGQHTSRGTYAWVSQAVHTIEYQAVQGDWNQWPQYSCREVAPDPVATEQHVLGVQLGT